MKLVNPPVALMFHEGARRLLAAGVHVPALAEGDRTRIALEAYPGLLVRKHLGIRANRPAFTRKKLVQRLLCHEHEDLAVFGNAKREP